MSIAGRSLGGQNFFVVIGGVWLGSLFCRSIAMCVLLTGVEWDSSQLFRQLVPFQATVWQCSNRSCFFYFNCVKIAVNVFSYNYVMIWFGRDLKDFLVPTCHGQGHLLLDQIAQGAIQAWPWTLAGIRHPQLLCTTCSSASPPLWQRISS